MASEQSDPTAPYDNFEGDVGRIFSTSTPQWPKPPTAAAGAPNVLVMLVDDLGYSDIGCYGAEIETPNIDQLADEGIRYANFHVNSMCSPTRASMLTGLNHHMAGVGHVAHFDPGFPGYAMELRENAVTMAELLRGHGWATYMVGKWHLCKDSNLSEAGPRHSWPLQKGFERYYGILDGFTNFHQPHRLYEDNHAVDVDEYPEDYYFTDDLTERAVAMIRNGRASHPDKPWFMYFSHGAVHAPLQAKRDDIEKYRGVYEQGWDAVRESRFERQKLMGLLAHDTVLPPRNTEERHAVKAWDELSDTEKALFARYQEIFAGMVDNVDQNFGRLRAALEEMGEWENTIVVFTSDNGGSREGEENGTSAYFRTLLAQARASELDDVSVDYARLDDMGGPQTLPHYPMGWAMVSSTPFRLYKINTHQGGHQVPFIVSWAKGLGAVGGSIRPQYQHITDLMPTLCSMLEIEMPTEKNGIAAPEPAGASFVTSFADERADSTHSEQYYEMVGHRGFYRDGWSAVTCHQPRTSFREESWQLHNLVDDPTETVDLAKQHPGRLESLIDGWESAAWQNQVFPLDEGNRVKALYRPPWADDIVVPVKIFPGTATVERYRCLQLILFRSFEIDIALEYQNGDEGTLFAHGDQGGGYGAYVVDGRLKFVFNAYGTMHECDCGEMANGTKSIHISVDSPGDGIWNITVSVDDVERGELNGVPVLMAMAPFQGIDVGIDRKSPVSWRLRELYGTFAYTGSLDSVTFTPGEYAPDAGPLWLDMLASAGTKYE
ncbi:MAG: arylsulfatase [Acidobacteria bacterium]|nr:arylsulfatase [Acidobacteriota bacterium]